MFSIMWFWVVMFCVFFFAQNTLLLLSSLSNIFPYCGVRIFLRSYLCYSIHNDLNFNYVYMCQCISWYVCMSAGLQRTLYLEFDLELVLSSMTWDFCKCRICSQFLSHSFCPICCYTFLSSKIRSILLDISLFSL